VGFKANEVYLGLTDSYRQNIRSDRLPGIAAWVFLRQFTIDQHASVSLDYQVLAIMEWAYPDWVDSPLVNLYGIAQLLVCVGAPVYNRVPDVSVR
jgi:hypothetical protein